MLKTVHIDGSPYVLSPVKVYGRHTNVGQSWETQSDLVKMEATSYLEDFCHCSVYAPEYRHSFSDGLQSVIKNKEDVEKKHLDRLSSFLDKDNFDCSNPVKLGATHKAIIKQLEDEGVYSLVEKEYIGFGYEEHALRAKLALCSVRFLNLKTGNLVVESTHNLMSDEITIFHPLAVVCLLKGNKNSNKYLKMAIQCIDSIKKAALEGIPVSAIGSVNKILKISFEEHARNSSIQYNRMLFASMDGRPCKAYLCETRWKIFQAWMVNLKARVLEKKYELKQKMLIKELKQKQGQQKH